jgi:hypothetical protein
MRFMVKVIWDVEKGNELARKGNLGEIAQSILEEIKKIRSNDYIDILRPPSIGMMAPLI